MPDQPLVSGGSDAGETESQQQEQQSPSSETQEELDPIAQFYADFPEDWDTEPVAGEDAPPEPIDVQASQETAPPRDEKTEYRSPYAARMTDEERAQAATLFDEQQVAFIENIVSTRLRQAQIATAQERQAASQLGVTPQFMQEFGPLIETVAPFVPEPIRGTPNGVQWAIQMALGEAAARSGDLAGTLLRASTLLQTAATPPTSGAPARAADANVRHAPATRAPGGLVSASPAQQRNVGSSRQSYEMGKLSAAFRGAGIDIPDEMLSAVSESLGY